MSTEKQKGKVADVNGVMVLGAENVSTRFLELLADINLEYPENGMQRVIIIPAGVTPFNFAQLEGKEISINLANHFTEAMDILQTGETGLSLRALVWHNLMVSLFHEVAHLEVLRDEPDTYPNGETAEIDTATTVQALHMLYGFVEKGYNVEPPMLWEMPAFHAAVEEQIQVFRGGNDPLSRAQVYMADNGLIYYDPDKGHSIMSMREYEQRFLPYILEDYGYTMPPFKEKTLDDVTEEVVNGTADTTVEVPPPPQSNAWVPPPPPAVAEPQNKNDLSREELDDMEMALEGSSEEFEDEETDMLNMAVEENRIAVQPAPPTPAAVTQDPKATGVICQAVYLRLYQHLFTACGWNGSAFTAPQGVLTPVDISTIPGAKNIFHSADIEDPQGNKLRNIPCNGKIRGEIFKRSGLPGYTLHLVVGNVAHERRLVPQNPDKMNNGQLTKTALAARGGARIAWLINTEANGSSKFVMKIENSNIIPL